MGAFIRPVMRIVLALFYGVAGYIHLANPAPFLAIMPAAIPYPEAFVFWTGVAELAGAAALVQPFAPKLRKAAGIGLALYAVCVWPANINHMILDLSGARESPLSLAYHAPRMAAQPVLIWLALWVSGTTNWPFRSVRSA